MKFGMPFSKIDSFSKVTEAFEILARVLSSLGPENFKNHLPWNMIDKPKWLKLFDSIRTIAEKVTFQKDVQVDGDVVTGRVRAKDGNGLKLEDGGGNGMFVKDGGFVGVGTSLPDKKLSVTKGEWRHQAIFGQDVPDPGSGERWIGIVIGSKDAYNKSGNIAWDPADTSFNLQVGGDAVGSALKIKKGGDVVAKQDLEVEKYTQLGNEAPKIKQKLFTFNNITSSAWTTTTAFSRSQVIVVHAVVHADDNSVRPRNYTFMAGFEFDVAIVESGGNLWVGYNVNAANDDNIDSGNATIHILVTYKE